MCARSLFIILFFNPIFLLGQQNPAPDFKNHKIDSLEEFGFEENKGQIKDQNQNHRADVLFSGTVNGLSFHIRNNGISYQLTKRLNNEIVDPFDTIDYKKKNPVSDSLSIYRVDVNWMNCNKNFIIEKDQTLNAFNNYYNVPIGIEPALYVRSFSGVWLKDIYAGIDLHYYNENAQLKYDYIVKSRADYHQIVCEIKGAELRIDENGNLILKTPYGEIVEGSPKVFQGEKPIEAKWKIHGNLIGFEIGPYDENEDLIIDPPVLVWGTYFGGSNWDHGGAGTVDLSGNSYLVGETQTSASIMATTGAHQVGYGGNDDAFIVKFNTNGMRVWSTFYGGSETDGGNSCALDNQGNIIVSGTTASLNNIATIGAHQPSFGGGVYDAFLVKFNSQGIRQWGTYYGGNNYDWGNSCAVDNNGTIYLAGNTRSTSSISTPSAHQISFGGNTDAYLVQFNSQGIRQWGTYYGGALNDEALWCATDKLNNVHLTGITGSVSNISSSGSHQQTLGGSNDAFLVKFNNVGTRQWGTYYGGSNSDKGYSCVVDSNLNVYLGGITASNSNIATPGSYQITFAGTEDIILIKFNESGNRIWGTYFGGSNDDDCWSINLDKYGNIFLTGNTTSTTNFSTVGAYQTNHNGGSNDAFLIKFNNNGICKWATYYGGNTSDHGRFCAVDSLDYGYIGGYTGSTSNIATSGTHQSTFGGGVIDAFLVKFDVSACTNIPAQPEPIMGEVVVCSGTNQTYFVNPDSDATHYVWNLPSDWSGSSNSNSINVVVGLDTGSITVFAVNSCGSSIPQSININLEDPPPIPSVIFGDTILCEGEIAVFSVQADTNALSYTWNIPIGWTGSSVSDSISVIPNNTSGIIYVTANNLCISEIQNLSIEVNPLTKINYLQSPSEVCIYNSAFILSQASPIGGIYSGNGVIGNLFDPALAGIGAHQITYLYTDTANCDNIVSQQIIVSECLNILEQEFGILDMYPNPTNDILHLIMEKSSGRIEISNLIGQVVKKQFFENSTNIDISLENLTDGIYLIYVIKEDTILNRKIVKRKL